MFAIKGLKLEVGAKFHGEWAHIATTHIFSGILSSVSFADKFRTTDGTFGTLLIEEINNTCTKRELFVYIPVNTSKGFPMSIKIESLLQVCISFAKVTE